MKIYFSQVWRDRAKVMLLAIIVCLVGPLMFPSSVLNEFFLLTFSLMMALPGIMLLKGDIWRFTHVIVEEHQFTSYSVFNRKLYTLDLAKLVYYEIFKARVDLFYIHDFIALSNDPFELEDHKDKRGFFVRYDQRSLLVMPYNDKTKPLVQINKWERICS